MTDDTVQWLSLPDAARSLGMAASTLRHQIRNGKMTARKVSRDWYVLPAEVERYRRENRSIR